MKTSTKKSTKVYELNSILADYFMSLQRELFVVTHYDRDTLISDIDGTKSTQQKTADVAPLPVIYHRQTR